MVRMRLFFVMHQVEHGQPGHQLGHQYGAVGGRTVYLGEGLLLLILLTYHKLQAKQIGDTEPLPGIASSNKVCLARSIAHHPARFAD